MVRTERGMVTAELAVGLLAALVLACGALWGVSLVVQQVVTGDLAAQAARQVARGDQDGLAAVRARVPQARIATRADGRLVRATAALPGKAWGVLPGVATTAEAVAVLEPGE